MTSDDERKLAHTVDTILNGPNNPDRKQGFLLLLFPFDQEPTKIEFITNAEPAGARELLARAVSMHLTDKL